MIPQTTLSKILDLAVQAPSGDNCQPWKFSRDGDQLLLINDIGRGRHFLNVAQRASLIASGAVLENISIAANAEGLDADVTLFPYGDEDPTVAALRFNPRAGPLDGLTGFSAIVRSLLPQIVDQVERNLEQQHKCRDEQQFQGYGIATARGWRRRDYGRQ